MASCVADHIGAPPPHLPPEQIYRQTRRNTLPSHNLRMRAIITFSTLVNSYKRFVAGRQWISDCLRPYEWTQFHESRADVEGA